MTLRDDILAAAPTFGGLSYRLDPPPDGISTIDCSLFVLKVLEKAGLALTGVRTAEQIRAATVPVDWDDVQPGDLLTFEHTYEPSEGSAVGDGHVASHIGISLGAGTKKMWDAHERNGADVAITDISSAYWQGHLLDARRLPALVEQQESTGDHNGSDPWQYFSADAITRATSANLAHVQQYWPKIVAQLDLAGINDRATQIAALATIAVEVGARFEPIHEYGTPSDWAGYSGGAQYAGRGFIQLTHDYNYRSYSQKLDDLWGDGAPDLMANPDDALDPDVASAVLALYFKDHGIPAMAATGNWEGVRKAVNGGLTGWTVFKSAVDALSGIQAPPVVQPPVPTTALPTRSEIDALIASLTDIRGRLPA